MTDAELGRDLAAALLAVHRMAARLMRSLYRPALADFEQVAASCVESSPLWVRALNHALAPIVKLDKFITQLEQLQAKMRRKARA